MGGDFVTVFHSLVILLMYRRFHRFLVLAVLSFAAAACVSVPEKPDAGHLAVAKRFLHNIDAGEWALLSIRLKIDEESKDQPGMAELTRENGPCSVSGSK